MAINFPASPTVGQIHTSGGASFMWDGVKWKSLGVDVLARSQNLADLQDKEVARQNLDLRWRVLARVDVTTAISHYPMSIPSDIELIRANFGCLPTSGDVNFVLRLSNNNAASFLAGASDYIQTYIWQNGNVAPIWAFNAPGSFITLSGPTQQNVPVVGSFTLHLGQTSCLAKVDYTTGNTNTAGQDQKLTGTGRPVTTGRMNGLALIFSVGNIAAGSYISIEGAS